MINNKGYSEKLEIATNPYTSGSILDKLSRDKSHLIKVSVADNMNTGAKTLIKMSKEKDQVIKETIARNPNTPVEILAKFLKFKAPYSPYVRANVASNPSTPIEMLLKLSQDEVWWVASHLIYNPTLPFSVLDKLTQDERCGVRETIVNSIIVQDALNNETLLDADNSTLFNDALGIVIQLMFDTDSSVRESIRINETIKRKLQDIEIIIPLISEEFIKNTINIEEILDKYKSKTTIIELLLSAVNDELKYDIDSFDKAYNAVTKNNTIPYIAAAIFGTKY